MPLKAVDESVLVLQLTDSHLFAGADGRLLGLDTADSLARVIDLALEEHAEVDLVLASGDLSQDGSVDSYRRFRELTARIPAPARWYPGNHDDLEAMRAVTRGTDLMKPVLDIGNWRIVMLDTLVPGSVAGACATISWSCWSVRWAKPRAPSAGQLPPSSGADRQRLDEPHRPAQPRGTVRGHRPPPGGAPGAMGPHPPGVRPDAQRREAAGVAVHRHPVRPGQPGFPDRHPGAGLPLLRLHADGRLETGVSRVEGLTFELEDGVKGY